VSTLERSDGVPTRGASLRAVIIGAALIPPNIFWVQSMELIWNSGQPTMLSLFFNAVFTLLVLSLLNLLLRWRLPRWALDPGELVVVYAMVSLGSAVGGHDFLQVLAIMLPTASYFATAENRWAEVFADELDSSLLVTDPTAVSDFWEGASHVYTLADMSPWLTPVAIWSGFVICLLAAMLCINSLIWRRWTDEEKLSYPLTEIPTRIASPGMQLIGPEMLGNRLFWIGFGLAAGVDLLNGFAHLYPGLPSIKVTAQNFGAGFSTYPWRAMGHTWTSFYPFAIGLGYLMPQDFLFSCWFFYWFWKAEMVMTWMTGHHHGGMPHVNEQTFGAYMGIALFALWTGRHYFADLLGTVLRGRVPPDESRQALPSRLGIGLLIAFLAALIWFMTALLRVDLPAALIYLVIYLIVSLAITRMRAEFGLPVHDFFYGPLSMMVTVAGSSAFSDRSLKGLGQLIWMERMQRSNPMPHGIEGLSLCERRGVPGSQTMLAMAIAVVVGTLAAFWAMVQLGTTHGFVSQSTDSPYLAMGGFSRAARWVRVPTTAHTGKLAALGVGGAFTIVLLLLRQRYLWWPFHPVGFAASSMWFIGLLWLPMFVAWLVKGTILRYAGHKLYARLIPVFVGLVIGEFLVGGLWGLVGAIGRFTTYRFWSY